MRTSSRKTSLKWLSPVICLSGRTSTPGWRIGHQKNEMPRCFGTSQFVRATSIPNSASLPLDVHTFCPLTTHSSPSRSARVCSPARSEPAPGSEYSRHIFTSSTSRRRTNSSLRASVPYASTVFAQRLCLSCAAPGAPTWRNSSTITSAVSPSRPRPNHSVGHVGTAYPASTTRASQSLRGSVRSQCSASQARTSSRSSVAVVACRWSMAPSVADAVGRRRGRRP